LSEVYVVDEGSALSYAKGPRTPLVKLTLSEALAKTAALFPFHEALVSRHQRLRYTWREFDEAVTQVAYGLAGLGLCARDRVGIWSTNCAEWILLQYACARAGLVLVNVNPAYGPYELSFVLGQSRMRALFLWAKDERSNCQEILDQARKPEDALEHVIRLGTSEWDTMLNNSAALSPEHVSPDDPTNIQYTSGTTGSPKGVLLTHLGLLNNGLTIGDQMNITERDRFCIPFPLYHCGGSVCCVLNCVMHGATIILPSATFEATSVLSAIQDEKATVVGGVPTMFIAELQHPDFSRFDLTTLRAALIGGSPCPVDLLRRMNSEMHCKEVSVVYGQTEASPVITMHTPGDTLEQRSSTVGKVMPNVEAKIIDSTGATVPLGETGELCARGYLVMSGYDQDPEATARAVDSDGWLHTGDLAMMREDGHFHIRGRFKEMIIRGGENVYPAEIEAFLFTHPKIGEASVVGLPDLKMGEIVAAWVRPKVGQALTAEEVVDYCLGKIAHFKVPQHVRIVESLPMTVSGKIQKFRIRESEIETLGLRNQITQTA
jgi:fatty-acyl-CoA synthase